MAMLKKSKNKDRERKFKEISAIVDFKCRSPLGKCQAKLVGGKPRIVFRNKSKMSLKNKKNESII